MYTNIITEQLIEMIKRRKDDIEAHSLIPKEKFIQLTDPYLYHTT